MNIVKFQDYITGNEFFDSNIKGKYAIIVNFIYIFPLGVEGLTDNIYNIMSLERTQMSEYPNREIHVVLPSGSIDLVRNEDYLVFDDYSQYVENIPGIDKYIYSNEFSTDDDITVDELKRFRTWLAEVLYANSEYIDQWSKDPVRHRYMLEYYINEMYDHVVRILSKFDSYVDITGINKQSGCGCANKNVDYTTDVMSICDPILIYRHNMYKYMIEIFSDITYWTGQEEICGEMKKYIDNIIKVGLSLTSTTLYDKFADCTCLNIDNNEQTTLTNILIRLSKSLGYIIDHEVSGNRNFISSAFLDWSTYLYEKMRW